MNWWVEGILRWWCFNFMVLLYSSSVLVDVMAQGCPPSSCGHISNISHPFRLPQDPPYCGLHGYELACENNVPLLYLNYSKNFYSPRFGIWWPSYERIPKYKVLGINYNNFTIRVLDPGIQPDNLSSLPLYSSHKNYDDVYDAFPSKALTEHIIYLNCSNNRSIAAEYVVDTGLFLKGKGHNHLYAVLGDLIAHNLKSECGVKSFTPITARWRWDSTFKLQHNTTNLSYSDIHRVLSYGFELSWWILACRESTCPSYYSSCSFNYTSEKLQCINPDCYTPLEINSGKCGNYSKLRIFAEDYLFGIYKGLNEIIGSTYEYYSDYEFDLTQLGIHMGVITGRYILPYITVRFLLGISFFSALLIHTCRRRHLSMYENIEEFLELGNLMPIRYSYKQIKKMTTGFKDKLGEGGFGTVYGGKLRSGPHVAIKMLGKSKANGTEFINEVATIGRIHHAHVVRLIGFCVEGSKRALIYEYMPNGSLDTFIFSKEGSIPLTYEQIHEISLGVARGIAYLHHGCDMQILHFDIKPHNILLDENFVPKVSDFGLARLYPVENSIVTLTAARGTIGYMAPELFYKNIGGVSHKADVYSFGMLLMEMAGRRRNLNPHAEHSSQLYFPLWIYDQFTEEKDIEIEDLTEEEKNLAKKMFIVALWCIQLKPSDRPSMNRVVEMLEAQVESLEMPPKPSLYPQETVAENCDEFNSDQTYASPSDSIHSPSYASDDVILEDSLSNGEE